MKRVIYRFRRYLRVSDNTALDHACEDAQEVMPLYVVSTWKGRHPWTGPSRQQFLCGCLESLPKTWPNWEDASSSGPAFGGLQGQNRHQRRSALTVWHDAAYG